MNNVSYADKVNSGKPTSLAVQVERSDGTPNSQGNSSATSVRDSDGFVHRVGRNFRRNQRRNSKSQLSGQQGPLTRKTASKTFLTGTKTGTNIKAVPNINKCRVFVSRLDPNLPLDTLKLYVSELINDQCTVHKLDAKYQTYSSYLLVCDEKYKEVLLCADQWEEGVLIRPFYGKMPAI